MLISSEVKFHWIQRYSVLGENVLDCSFDCTIFFICSFIYSSIHSFIHQIHMATHLTQLWALYCTIMPIIKTCYKTKVKQLNINKNKIARGKYIKMLHVMLSACRLSVTRGSPDLLKEPRFKGFLEFHQGEIHGAGWKSLYSQLMRQEMEVYSVNCECRTRRRLVFFAAFLAI